jgi:ABC-type phosphate/phosphonate transport system substrate-binding protein
VGYVIAWQSINGTSGTRAQYQTTVDYLSATLNQTFSLLPVADSADIIRLGQNGSADFVVAPGTALQCLQISNETRPIATLLEYADGVPVPFYAGLILSTTDRNITTYQDVKGKIVSGGQLTGLGAFQAQWGALQRKLSS